MKKDSSKLITGMLAIGLFFSFFQIYTLKSEIQVLKKRINNNYTALENDIQNIYSNVNYQLENQANLLNEYKWEYISADISAGTAIVKCDVAPKEYTASTQAVITVAGTDTPMSFANGKYTTSVTVPLYTDCLAENVRFIDEDRVRSQQLNWSISPKNQFLTSVFSQFENSSGKATHTNNGIIWNHSGIIAIDVQRKDSAVDIQDVYLITEKNGEIIDKQKLSVKEGMKKQSKDSNAVPVPEPDFDYPDDIHTIELRYEKQFEVAIEKGSEILLKTEIVDGDGLHHITTIEGWRITESGENQTYMSGRGSEAEIFSADGTPLFTYADKTHYWF